MFFAKKLFEERRIRRGILGFGVVVQNWGWKPHDHRGNRFAKRCNTLQRRICHFWQAKMLVALVFDPW